MRYACMALTLGSPIRGSILYILCKSKLVHAPCNKNFYLNRYLSNKPLIFLCLVLYSSLFSIKSTRLSIGRSRVEEEDLGVTVNERIHSCLSLLWLFVTGASCFAPFYHFIFRGRYHDFTFYS